MKPKAFFILRNDKADGPYSKEELERAAYLGEIQTTILYSYDRARQWRPLSHLIGEIPAQTIEDNQKRYYVTESGAVRGPLSYNELFRLMEWREIDHSTLYAKEGTSEWRPLSKLPIPHIPRSGPPEGMEDIPHESEWIAKAEKHSTDIGDGITFTSRFGVVWSDDAYYLWVARGPKSSNPGKMYVGGPISKQNLQEQISQGTLDPDTMCGKIGSLEWLKAREHL